MKPTKKDRKKFDIDLEFGSIREDKVAEMLCNKRIEVKSERGMWMDTGNIAIEYESYGKPSGIEATESDYWFHHLCVGDKEYCTLVFHTEVLRTIVKELDSSSECNIIAVDPHVSQPNNPLLKYRNCAEKL